MINIGISSLINNERMLLEIPDTVKVFLNILISSLNKEKMNESKKLKKLNQKEIKGSFVKLNQSFSDSDIDEEGKFSPVTDIDKTPNSNIIEIKKKDIENYDQESQDIDTENEIEEIIVI